MAFLIVRVSTKNDIVQLHLKVQMVGGFCSVELNCTTAEEPFAPVGFFFLNNVSLANISLFNGTCYLSRQKCQYFQCECGLKYFIYKDTLPLPCTRFIFTCEIRFNMVKGEYKRHVAVRASVFYNSSGTYQLKEIQEEKGPASVNKKPDTHKDNVTIWIAVISSLAVVVALPIIVYWVCKKSKSSTADNDIHDEIDSHDGLQEPEGAIPLREIDFPTPMPTGNSMEEVLNCKDQDGRTESEDEGDTTF